MKRMVLWIGLSVLLFFGCARVRVEAPKEAIKMDITMRLDIYQHIQKDISAIEDIVSTPKKEALPLDSRSFLNTFVGYAYAEEAFSPEVEQAALRRKDRRDNLFSFEKNALIGENKSGMVELRKPEAANKEIEDLIRAENTDRLIIYRYIAQKNSISLEEVEKMYAQRLQNDAPVGAPIEILNASSGNAEWKIK